MVLYGQQTSVTSPIAPRIQLLKGKEIPPFAKFTFPAYQSHCHSGDSKVVALGLFDAEEACGLALGVFSNRDPTRATALSILVSETYRGCGIGRHLLDAFEEELVRRGCRSVTGKVTGSEKRSLAVERLLARSGWRFHGPSSVLCQASQKLIMQAPWLAEASLPKGMEIFPWLELLPSERAGMLAREAHDPWIPENLNPFWNERLIAGCSVGMRYQGRVAGWCVAYKFEYDSLRWWRMFVVKELQRTARALPLLAETIRRAPDYGFHFGVWSVRSDNQAMMRLLNRRMKPWLISAKPVWAVEHRLLGD